MNVTLNNGITMPQLGFGVWQVKEGKEVISSVKKAIEVGYRSIDTAALYQNEEGVGEAIHQSTVPRDELFITTKVWNNEKKFNQGFEETLQSFEASLNRLGLDYLDLYLIHWPVSEEDRYIESYHALEKLYQDGKVRAIGVSNFHIPHLQRILAECTVPPVVNQIELHPFLSQVAIREFCAKNDIFVQAWSPLMSGGEVLTNKTIKELAGTYKKTPAQIILRWHLQNNIIVIPKSITPSRIEENFDVFDFELSTEDMKKIDALNKNKRLGPDPDTEL